MKTKCKCVLFLLLFFSAIQLWADETITTSFARPADMVGAVKDIKNLTLKKMGTFSGNEREGFFMIGGITGRYRVNENMIVFTINFAENINSILQRDFMNSALFSFSIEKPNNIIETLETVRVGIESKGGFFTAMKQADILTEMESEEITL